MDITLFVMLRDVIFQCDLKEYSLSPAGGGRIYDEQKSWKRGGQKLGSIANAFLKVSIYFSYAGGVK